MDGTGSALDRSTRHAARTPLARRGTLMAEERAFTRRRLGANPIALELDRLAEQRALQTLGNRRGAYLPRSEDQTATDAPMATPEEIEAEERYAQQMQERY